MTGAAAPPERPAARTASRLPALGPRGEGWFAGQVVLLAAVAVSALASPAWSGPLREASAAAGIALVAGGGILAVRGVLDLGGSLTVLPRPRPGSRLVATGAYAHARHPIYGGLIVGALGWALATASVPGIVSAAALAALLTLKSIREEVWLGEAYAGYGAYRRRTRRLIPWVF